MGYIPEGGEDSRRRLHPIMKRRIMNAWRRLWRGVALQGLKYIFMLKCYIMEFHACLNAIYKNNNAPVYRKKINNKIYFLCILFFLLYLFFFDILYLFSYDLYIKKKGEPLKLLLSPLLYAPKPPRGFFFARARAPTPTAGPAAPARRRRAMGEGLLIITGLTQR